MQSVRWIKQNGLLLHTLNHGGSWHFSSSISSAKRERPSLELHYRYLRSVVPIVVVVVVVVTQRSDEGEVTAACLTWRTLQQAV